jgi:hypothetical protein
MLKRQRWGFIIKDMTAKSNSKKRGGKYLQAAEIQAAVDYGIDISMLIDNIGRSYSERIKRHQIALNTAEKLKGARRV